MQKLEKALSVMKYLPNEQQLSALIRVLEAVDIQATIDLSARPEITNSSRQHIADMIKKVFYEDRSLEYTYISDGSPQAVITILRDLTTRTWHASFLLSEGNNIDFRGPFLLGNDIGQV